MLRHLALMSAALCAPAAALADCSTSGTPMFVCRLHGEPAIAEACLEGAETVVHVMPLAGAQNVPEERYVLGAKDLQLRRSEPGAQDFWEEIEFRSKSGGMVLAYAVPGKGAGRTKAQGVFVVIDPAGVPLDFSCKPGSFKVHDFAPLAQVLEANGHAWCGASRAWEKRC
jgi:hypothetical protein